MKNPSTLLLFLLPAILFSSCSSRTETHSLQAEIEDLFSTHKDTYALWFEHLQLPDLSISINPDTLFHAASTMKTPVMVDLFRRAELGEFSLQDSIRTENRFYSIVDGSEFQLDLDPYGDSYVLIFLSKNLPDNLIGTETGTIASEMIYNYLSRDL